jgi:RNA polymerase sigma-32 factor
VISYTQPNALSVYRAGVARGAPLTADLERELVARYREGDGAAGNRLIEACLPLVTMIAIEYRKWGTPLEDLIQQGNIGLLKAVRHFDPERGARLATYARYWVRAEIREHVVCSYRIVRLGRSKAERRALRYYRKTREQQPEVLAEMTGLSAELAAQLLPVLASADVSLNQDTSDDRRDLVEHMPHLAKSPEEALAEAEARHRLRSRVACAVSRLSTREQEIVRQRLLSDEPTTLERLGEAWGVSKERVRQLEQSAKQRMRSWLERASDNGELEPA